MFPALTDDEKPPPAPASVNTVPYTGPPAKPAPHAPFLDKLQELNTSRCDYLKCKTLINCQKMLLIYDHNVVSFKYAPVGNQA